MSFDVALLTFGVLLLLLGLIGNIKTQYFEVKGINRWVRFVAVLVAVIFIATSFAFNFPKAKEIREDKRDIYTFFSQKITQLESTIQRLRRENLALRDKLIESGTYLPPFRTIYGRISSSDGVGLADAKVVVISGSQVFSNPNGEFSLDSMPGQTITIEKSGYKTYRFTVNPQHFENYQEFTLRKDEP